MAKEPSLKKIWHLATKLCLLLSHGQAQVERGFPLNKEASDTNMGELTLINRRLILDGISDVGGRENVALTSWLLGQCSSAGTRYKQFMAQRKADAAENERKRKLCNERKELEVLQAKRRRLGETIKGLEEAMSKTYGKAEQAKNCHTLLVQANSIRRTVADKKIEEAQLGADIQQKKQKDQVFCKGQYVNINRSTYAYQMDVSTTSKAIYKPEAMKTVWAPILCGSTSRRASRMCYY